MLTEARLDLVERHWPHVIHVGRHPGSGQPQGSKVVIASHEPITLIDEVGSPNLPARNFLAIDAHSRSGWLVCVIGIVVRYVERARYLDAPSDALARRVTANTVLAGDFNLSMGGTTPLGQRLGRVLEVHHLRIVTLGPYPVLDGGAALDRSRRRRRHARSRAVGEPPERHT